MRLIAIALLVAPLLFAGVVAWLRTEGEFRADADLPFLDVGAAGLGLALAVAGPLARGAIWRRGAQGPAHLRAQAYAQGVLVGCALLEGGILLNLVAAMLIPLPWTNVGVAALAFALAATSLPSEFQRDDAGLRP